MGVDRKPTPPTLRCLNSALVEDYGKTIEDYSLMHWVRQGALLLNATLTVERGNPNSHETIWRDFMSKTFENIHHYNPNLIWVLLGKSAQSRVKHLSLKPEQIVEAPHPMVAIYQSITAFTNFHIFRKINEKLEQQGLTTINFSS